MPPALWQPLPHEFGVGFANLPVRAAMDRHRVLAAGNRLNLYFAARREGGVHLHASIVADLAGGRLFRVSNLNRRTCSPVDSPIIPLNTR
jgi:hypothetical protein